MASINRFEADGLAGVMRSCFASGGRNDERMMYLIRYCTGCLLLSVLVACSESGPVPSKASEAGAEKSLAEPASLLIINAQIIDGTGSPGRRGAVRVSNGIITEVGEIRASKRDVVYDAQGLVLSPGFIDTHSHMDGRLADQPDVRAALSQGITTMVVGQDGGSQSIAELAALVAHTPIAANIATYTGHGTLRLEVMGDDANRQATTAEIDAMSDRLSAELAAGSLGLATGLEYEPGMYSSTDELISLAKVAASQGGRYISHIRSEDRKFFEAIDELIEIGRQSGVPVQVSHIKLARIDLWGKAREVIAKLDHARHEGIDVTADIYPYTYWQSTLRVLLPERNYHDVAAVQYALDYLAKPEDLTLSKFVPDPSLEGRTIAEIALLRETEPAETYLALIREAYEGADPTEQRESVIGVSMSESDIHALIKWEHTNLCSDGASSGGHPRGYGSFPRAIRMFVREQHLLDLPEMVRKMTSLSAAHVGLHDRGIIAPGYAADLLLFDPDEITDHATMKDSTALSTGVQAVWVNGQQVFTRGESLAARPGRLLRRSADAIEDRAVPATKTLDEHLSTMANQGQFNGAVMVAANGVVEYAKAFGVADVLNGRKLDIDSVFELGSVGKAFTAAAIFILADGGKLDLDDLVAQHL
ncbi:MAG: amidohydrolase family protein, partial [Gammaproteobacteria bacterium]|nr:amidohydrolase family protein [Gammaproteobacteria bacterium]